jgi:hypothetical protein
MQGNNLGKKKCSRSLIKIANEDSRHQPCTNSFGYISCGVVVELVYLDSGFGL